MRNICGLPFKGAENNKSSRTRRLPLRKAIRSCPAGVSCGNRSSFENVSQREVLREGSRRRTKTSFRGGMTFECAVTLPFYLMFLFALSFYMVVIGSEVTESLKLYNTARQVSSIAGLAGTDAGIDYVDLHATKEVALPFASFFGAKVKVPVRARVRSFTGLDVGEDAPTGNAKATYYVTDTKSVYHTHPECTHLSLTVFKTDTATIRSLRNNDGKRYRPGSDVPAGYEGTVYASANGLYYYTSASYHSLVRHVHVVSDTQGLKLCERCAALDRAG